MKLLCLLIFSVLCATSPILAQNKTVTLVIDPGHGGDDPGHLPNNTNLLPEKDLNLKIAKYFGNYIEKYLQNVKVVYTRTTDVYPSLDDRVNKANNLNADYFISIHCNGNERTSVRGTETHVHSMGLKESVQWAKEIEQQFSKRAGRKSRGVKDKRDLQHSLQVLKFTNMTSVLVECGFITNDAEAAYLNSTYGQEIIASAIFRAFRSTIESQQPGTKFRKTTNSTTTNTTETTTTSEAKFSIQIASSKSPIDPKKDPQMRKLDLAVTRKELNTSSAYKYIYLAGSFDSKDSAKQALEGVKSAGFRDAIIVKK
ncbi:N-acetylmuramoyl-L-alanine amidase [Crocinitomicaceae bacterium]|nr:N-acetylmuramoyl-L-alanine amidase [Crocinitomicaceae bacterium]